MAALPCRSCDKLVRLVHSIAGCEFVVEPAGPGKRTGAEFVLADDTARIANKKGDEKAELWVPHAPRCGRV